jgi:hypothetical protein
MKRNVGKTDRIIRIVIGILIAVAGVVFKSWWGLLAIIPLFTGIVGWCALYVPFGISSTKKKS